MSGWRVPSCCILLLGCGTDEHRVRRPTDAGTDAAEDGGIVTVPIDQPAMEPCPPGWRLVEVDDLSYCDPWPDGPETCADGEAHFPGTPGCEPVGSTCPDGDWAEVPDTAIFVRAGAAGGGDGTRARPFRRIADALAAADPGDVVALSTGTFDEAVTVSVPVTLRGACTARTTIASSSPSDAWATITLAAGGARLHDLQVGGERIGVAITAPSSPAVLESVVVRSARLRGVEVRGGARADLRRVVVETTRPAEDGRDGFGLRVLAGAQVTVEQAVLARNGEYAIDLDGAGASLDAASMAVRETLPLHIESIQLYGGGIRARLGGSASIERSVFEWNSAVDLDVFQGDVTLSDSLVRGTGGTDDVGDGGIGALASAGSSLTLSRVAFVSVRDGVIFPFGEGATVRGSDVVILSVRDHSWNCSAGYAIQSGYFAVVDLERVVIRDSLRISVFAYDEGTVRLSNAIVEDTARRNVAEGCSTDQSGGIGVSALDAAHVGLSRFRVSGNVLAGLQVTVGGGLDLSYGDVSGNTVGVNVQDPDYDVSRLRSRVLFRDNGRNLDSSALPVPTPSGL